MSKLRLIAFCCALGMPCWAAGVRGTLHDAGGAPVADATVWLLLRDDDGNGGARRLTTAADGAFEYRSTGQTRYHALLVARVPGRGSVAQAVTKADEPVQLALAPGHELTGQVVDPDGKPWAGVSVCLSSLQPRHSVPLRFPEEVQASLWRTETDQQGIWRLTEVPDADRQVSVAGRDTTLAETRIGPGYQYAPACITTLRAAGELRGVLHRADGTPAVGERLIAEGEIVRCDAQGRFAFAHAPRDEDVAIAVVTTCACGDTAGPRIGTGRVGCDASLSLPRKGRLRGQVMLDTGQPAAGVEVAYSAKSYQVSTRTDATGHYEMEVWPSKGSVYPIGLGVSEQADDFEVPAGGTVQAPTLVGHQSDPSPLRAAMQDTRPVSRLRPKLPGVASGQVVDGAGRPASGVLVYAEGYLGEHPAVTDAAGRFTCRELPTSRVTLVALRGRADLARLEATPPAEGLRLVLATQPEPTRLAATSEADRAMARELIDAALAQQRVEPAEWLALLAQLAPELALDRAAYAQRREPDSLLVQMLTATKPGLMLGERLVPMVASIKVPECRAEAAFLASDHLPPARRDLHGQLLAIARGATAAYPGAGQTGGVSAATRLSGLARLALRAGEPATAELDGLVTIYGQLKEQGRAAWCLEAIRPSAELLDNLAQRVPADEAVTVQRCGALAELFAVDPTSAWAMARRWWPAEGEQVAWPLAAGPLKTGVQIGWRERPALAAAVARQICARDGAAALLRQPGLTYEQALIGAVLADSRDTAQALAARAQALCPEELSSAAARLALLAGIDSDVAERSRRRTLSEWTFDPCLREAEDMNTSYAGEGTAEVAYMLALVEPNRTRWLAETRFSTGWPLSVDLATPVLTMAAADRGRARAMVQTLGVEGYVSLELAKWLLSDGGERVLYDKLGTTLRVMLPSVRGAQ